jgi:ribosomal protein S18 acetylase RimI-like enzyme
MDFTFRRALPSDYDAADRIVRAAFTPYVRRVGREVGPDFNFRLGASIERGDVYVAEEADRIIGVAVTERRDDSLYIDRLAVDPQQQQGGVGRWLLAQLEGLARSRGDGSLSLETAEMMEHLVRFYSGFGFEIVGRGPPSHGKDPHMRVQMAKPLSAA